MIKEEINTAFHSQSKFANRYWIFKENFSQSKPILQTADTCVRVARKPTSPRIATWYAAPAIQDFVICDY